MDQAQIDYYQRQNLSIDDVKKYRALCKPKMFWTPWMCFWVVLSWVLIAAGIFLATVPL